MKTAYVICTCIEQLVLIIMAIIAPTVLDPGNYWWPLGCIILMFASGYALGDRLDKWE